MRLADRPRAGTDLEADAPLARDLNADADGTRSAMAVDRGGPRGLADRLARLPDAHPSAARQSAVRPPDQAGADYDDETYGRGGADDLDSGGDDDADYPAADVGQDELGQGGLGGDEPGPDELGGDELGGGEPAGHAVRARRAGDAPAWGELGGPMAARSPYRPWFGADGAADPWFAADLSE